MKSAEPLIEAGKPSVEMGTPKLILLVAGVLVALLAQFALDAFADSSQLGHWFLHGLLFAGGFMVGAGLLQLRAAAGQQLA